MLKIRLQRFGRKREPAFRVVLTDSRSGPKSGKFLEVLGSYDPRRKERDSKILKQERILYWISKGAQTSDTVHNLLVRHRIIKGKKIDVSSKKKKKKNGEVPAPDAERQDVGEAKKEEQDLDDVKEEKTTPAAEKEASGEKETPISEKIDEEPKKEKKNKKSEEDNTSQKKETSAEEKEGLSAHAEEAGKNE